MSGRHLRIMPHRSFDFGSLQAGGEEFIVLAERVDVSQWRHATLCVRLHESSIGSGASLQVFAAADGYSSDDPTARVSDENPLGSVSFTTAGEPKFKTAGLDADRMGALIMVWLRAEQAAGSPVSLQVTLSIDLVLKS
jgi:hypothetical protein